MRTIESQREREREKERQREGDKEMQSVCRERKGVCFEIETEGVCVEREREV